MKTFSEELNHLESLIKYCGKIHQEQDISDETFVIEECSEFIKECMKCERGHSRNVEKSEECCDIICAALIYLYSNNYDFRTIGEYIEFKYKRAITRYQQNPGSV